MPMPLRVPKRTPLFSVENSYHKSVGILFLQGQDKSGYCQYRAICFTTIGGMGHGVIVDVICDVIVRIESVHYWHLLQFRVCNKGDFPVAVTRGCPEPVRINSCFVSILLDARGAIA
jgi:hypothetical protein